MPSWLQQLQGLPGAQGVREDLGSTFGWGFSKGTQQETPSHGDLCGHFIGGSTGMSMVGT